MEILMLLIPLSVVLARSIASCRITAAAAQEA